MSKERAGGKFTIKIAYGEMFSKDRRSSIRSRKSLRMLVLEPETMDPDRISRSAN